MIVFLINELDVRGGTHKQFLKLLEYTSKNNIDFEVFTRKLDYSKTYPGFLKFSNRIHVLDSCRSKSRNIFSRFWAFYTNCKCLCKAIEKFDVINIHDCGFEMMLFCFKGKRVIWQVNDLPSAFRVGNWKGRDVTLKSKLQELIITLQTKYISDFTVNVTKNKERIKHAFNRDASVFYCGIEPVGIKRNVKSTIDNFSNAKLNLLSSGVFFKYRNYETQIAVVKSLIEKGIDVHLNIIGSTDLDKEYADHIRFLIEENGLSDRIIICGQVNDQQFRELHRQSDLFLFINIDQSWGLAVFEAMSCSIPVIVSNSVGATEILTNNKNALFVDPLNVQEIVDKIIYLMGNTSQYVRLSEESGKFHHDYSWDNSYSSPMLRLILSK